MPSTTVVTEVYIYHDTSNWRFDFCLFCCQGSGRQLKPAEGRMLTVCLAAVFPTSDSCGLLRGLLQAKVGGYRTSIFQVCS